MLEEQKKIEMSRMSQLKELGVDLTAYLVSQQKVPDKHYKFDTSSPSGHFTNGGADDCFQSPIQVHLHEWISTIALND